MEERPTIKLEFTTADKTFEIIGWLLIISVWGLTITNYASRVRNPSRGNGPTPQSQQQVPQ